MTKRSYSQEYLALLGSFILIGLEIVVRGITLALRMFLIILLLGEFVANARKLVRSFGSAINVRGDCSIGCPHLKGGDHEIRRNVRIAEFYFVRQY